MASTPVHLFAPTGLTLTLTLYAQDSDTAASSDSLTEATNRKGLYTCTVTEALDGLYYAKITDGSGTLIANYVVLMADDTDIHVCGDYFVGNLASVDGETEPITAFKNMLKSTLSGNVVADGSNTGLTFKTDLTTAAANYFGTSATGGNVLAFVEGSTNEYQARRIVAFNATTKFVTVESAFNGTPAGGDTFLILGWIEAE